MYVGDTSYKIMTNLDVISGSKDSDIQLFPNPVKEIIYISGVESNKITIRDLTGKTLMVLSDEKAINKINVSGLAGGMYIMSAKTGNGMIEKTFIKE